MCGDEMTKQERAKFYKSKKWKNKCKVILKRDRYRCQLSKRYGKQVDAEIVHHIYPLSVYPEYRLKSWNLIAVSRSEHNRLHNRATGELTDYGRQLMHRTQPPGVSR